MQPDEFIPAGEFCARYQIEFSFISYLHDSGLIELTTQNGNAFLPTGELPALEKFVRWHYDLAINPEGIEVIAHLLQKIGRLQDETLFLRNLLQRFQGPGQHPVQPGEEI